MKSCADKNLLTTIAQKENFDYYDFREFGIEGLPWYDRENKLYRMPEELLEKFNENMNEIARCPSGGLIRFKTDTSKMALFCTYSFKSEHETLTQCADAGFDLYMCSDSGYEFAGNFRPDFGEDFLNVERPIPSTGKMEEYILYFPLYSHIDELKIGVQKGMHIQKTEPKIQKKILFYGSSVTNGSTACRPGLTYPAVLCRRLGAEMINLGYSGNCKGEGFLAREMGALDFDAFVMEYDHNEADPKILAEKHENFFKIIRNSKADIPIVIMSRPDFFHTSSDRTLAFKEVVYTTYRNAVDSGDGNVYFADGRSIFPDEGRSDFSSDRIHPNDMGLYTIANVLYDIFNKLNF